MFIVERVPPKRMLQLSTLACLLSSSVVAARAGQSEHVLFASALVFGFAVSWQFGAAYSWASEHIDVAVRD